MIIEPTSSERISEVLRLATALAERALDEQIADRPVPADQTVALAKAGRLLQDNGVDWPPLLTQVLHELAGNGDKTAANEGAEPATLPGLPDVDLHGLARFFAGFRKDKGQP